MKKTISTLTLATLIPVLAIAQEAETDATQSEAPAAPCSSDAYRQFDFWIGEWAVSQPNGTVAGENSIQPILNGCVLMEQWQGAGGSTGKSFNMYDAPNDKWRQTWVDGNGGRLDLAGRLDGEAMVLSGERPGRDGAMVSHEIRWTPQDDGTVRQHWRASRDGGETWNDLFVGIYTKKDS